MDLWVVTLASYQCLEVPHCLHLRCNPGDGGSVLSNNVGVYL